MHRRWPGSGRVVLPRVIVRRSSAGAPPGGRVLVLGVLCVVAAVNLIDRQLITILLDPIKREFHASDTLMGLLTGLSFSLVYVTAALPIARWSDRGIRRNVIAGCIGVWGAMTMLCGFASSYAQLAAARMGVAVGEAGYNPAAHSMIADLFPLRHRGAAFGAFNAAASIGIGFGLFYGGWLNAHFAWRTVFIIVGAPCLILALLVRFFLSEPQRGFWDPPALLQPAPTWRETIARLAGLRSFRFLALSSMTCAFINYGMQVWIATFFIRVHGIGVGQVGLKLGLASALGLLAGTICSGTLADRLGSRDVRWYMRISGIGMLLTMPFGLLTLTTASTGLSFIYYCVTIGLLASWASPIHAMTQAIAEPRMRGIAAAIVGFCLNLVGYGLGPVFVGALNDQLQPRFGVQSVRYSLMLLLAGCMVAAIVCFSTNRSIREDLRA